MIKNFTRMMHTAYGQLLISVVLGVGLASLFRKTCTEKGCYKFIAPKVSETENNIYLHDGHCYKFKTQTKPCGEKPISFV